VNYWIGIILVLILFLLWAERGRLIRMSTLQGLKANGFKRVINLQAIHMYIYGRWTKQYIKVLRDIIVPRLDAKGKKKLADSYHSKVLTTEQAKNIIMINKDIPLTELEQVITYPTARKIVLQCPLDIVVMECPCRANMPNPCRPSDVCMVVGQPFTDFVIDHNPTAKRLSQKEALDLLEVVHQRGWVHTAWFKDATLDRFYVICNCCSCCCGGLKAMMQLKQSLIPRQ
jgi:hypothetical protein